MLDNYAVLDEINDGSCIRSEFEYPHRLNFAEDYRKKVTSFTIAVSGKEADKLLTGYRIVPRTGDEKNGREEEREEKEEDEGKNGEKSFNSNGGSTPGELFNILMSLLVALTYF